MYIHIYIRPLIVSLYGVSARFLWLYTTETNFDCLKEKRELLDKFGEFQNEATKSSLE